MNREQIINQYISVYEGHAMEKEELEIMLNGFADDIVDNLQPFLPDNLSEEPVSNDLEKKTFDDYLKASPAERRKMNMAEILGEERLAKTKERMDLEEAAEEYEKEHTYQRYDGGGLTPEYDATLAEAFIAGAEWGANHLRDTTKKVSEDLEEAAKKYDEAESWRYEALKYPRRDAFEAGAEWQKEQTKKGNPIVMSVEDFQVLIDNTIKRAEKEAREQMMKDAVEGEVCGRVKDHINVRFPDGLCKYLKPENISHIPADVTKYNVGDKVRVVIVKEEEK